MKNYLLIISCSQRKRQDPESSAAIEVYDGQTYRVLRKMGREGTAPKNVDVLIISAKYSLIGAQFPIDVYDQKMTAARAKQLRSDIQEKLQRWIATKRWKMGGYDQVFINLGKDYMRTLEGFHWGLLSTLEVSGGIGQKTSQMKAWLERIYQEGIV